MNFGSGAVKITPEHDPNDFECGLRNGLPQINILNDGEINENGGKFRGMKRYEVRNLLTEELK
jgi:valyl-tRNA synthetase